MAGRSIELGIKLYQPVENCVGRAVRLGMGALASGRKA